MIIMFPAKHYESLAFQIASEIWGIQKFFILAVCPRSRVNEKHLWLCGLLGGNVNPWSNFLDMGLRIWGLFWQRIGFSFGDSVILLVLQFIQFWRIFFGNDDLSVWTIAEEGSHKQSSSQTCTHFRTFSWNVCSGLERYFQLNQKILNVKDLA